MQWVVFLLSLGLLQSCGSPDPETDTSEPDGAFDSLTESLESAEQLENRALQRKQEMDDALERMDRETDEGER